ncbi:pathogenesis-related protein 1-like [Triticum dicoccoides]|uniref:pathogenesis-related protein 1-like n=1 Tax=Triticum dicoccoides TaxID=85692 RepID=UPI0018914E3E|nr:pathogenesis-related protein 1-like [Triticum dicoccoides]
MATQKLAMAMAISAAVLAGALSQNSPEDYVRLHNAARGAAGAQPVAWDDEVAREAGKRTERGCGLRRPDGAGYDDEPRHHRYGENLFRGPPEKAWNAGDALDAWTAPAAREYVQVVWPDSTKIGCARAVCGHGRGVFISCNYEPAGNELIRAEIVYTY